MKTDETQFGTMLHALQERAKELNCLYQVGELLSQSKRPLEEIFRGIIELGNGAQNEARWFHSRYTGSVPPGHAPLAVSGSAM